MIIVDKIWTDRLQVERILLFYVHRYNYFYFIYSPTPALFLGGIFLLYRMQKKINF
jgi:hypothetical protein